MSAATKAADTFYAVTEKQQRDAMAGEQECIGKRRAQLKCHRPLSRAHVDGGTAIYADKPVCRRLIAKAANDSALSARSLLPVNMSNVITWLVVAQVQKLKARTRAIFRRARTQSARGGPL